MVTMTAVRGGACHGRTSAWATTPTRAIGIRGWRQSWPRHGRWRLPIQRVCRPQSHSKASHEPTGPPVLKRRYERG
jgi:hypothetical protein